MKTFRFDPAIFRPIAEWHAAGKIPLHFNHLQLICRKGRFPAVMIGGKWHTSEQWIDAYFSSQINEAARELLRAEEELAPK